LLIGIIKFSQVLLNTSKFRANKQGVKNLFTGKLGNFFFIAAIQQQDLKNGIEISSVPKILYAERRLFKKNPQGAGTKKTGFRKKNETATCI
jgi:hypothetical protein